MEMPWRRVALILVASVLVFMLIDQNAFCNSEIYIDDCYASHKATADHYLQNGKFDLAVAEYEKTIELNPKSIAAYFNLAIANYSNGDLRRAVSTLEKLVELEPMDVEAHYNLGCLKLLLRDMKGSKSSFETAKLRCPRSPEFSPLINQGLEFLDEFGKLDPATQDLNLFFLQASLPSQTQTLVS